MPRKPGKTSPRAAKAPKRGSGEDPALVIEADGGNAGAIARLLDAGADVNQPAGVRPPYYAADALTVAAGKGHEAVVKLLLERGAALATESGLGTALERAVSHGHTSVVRLLLSAGADNVGYGPFNAITAGHFDTLRALADAGVTLGKLRSRWKESLLTVAAQRGPREVECLLGLGLKPADGAPLYQAILSTKAETVRLLLDAGADPDAPDRVGSLPVMAACLNGDLAVLDWLAERGADFSATDSTGKDCRYWARQSRHARRVLTWLKKREQAGPSRRGRKSR